jgi:hypothetical protein
METDRLALALSTGRLSTAIARQGGGGQSSRQTDQLIPTGRPAANLRPPPSRPGARRMMAGWLAVGLTWRRCCWHQPPSTPLTRTTADALHSAECPRFRQVKPCFLGHHWSSCTHAEPVSRRLGAYDAGPANEGGPSHITRIDKHHHTEMPPSMVSAECGRGWVSARVDTAHSLDTEHGEPSQGQPTTRTLLPRSPIHGRFSVVF